MQVLSAWSPRHLRWLALLLALGCVSCSGGAKLNPVTGQVYFRDKPTEGIVVTFHPTTGGADLKTLRPIGTTGPDGTFTVETGSKAGAPEGSYTVSMIWPRDKTRPKGSMSTEPPESFDALQGAYDNPAATGIKVEIKSGENKLEPFRLK